MLPSEYPPLTREWSFNTRYASLVVNEVSPNFFSSKAADLFSHIVFASQYSQQFQKYRFLLLQTTQHNQKHIDLQLRTIMSQPSLTHTSEAMTSACRSPTDVIFPMACVILDPIQTYFASLRTIRRHLERILGYQSPQDDFFKKKQSKMTVF